MTGPTSSAPRYSREWLDQTGLEECPDEQPHTVTYSGFFFSISRTFPTRERAEQWARQVGVYSIATILPA